MSLGIVILFVTIMAAMIVVRIGGIALELTGLEHSVARFQALSAFTGTGFTTREAEQIVDHPERRRIISILILGGNAGLITAIAGLAQTFGASLNEEPRQVAVIFAQLAGVGVSLYLLYRIILWPRISRRIDRAIRSQLEARITLTPAEIEELLQSAEGWGIARVEVPAECQFAGKPMAETRPHDQGILIIAIERDGKLIPSPHGNESIQVGDRLIVYGKLTEMPALLRGQTSPAHRPAS